jgi:hypothetical protein
VVVPPVGRGSDRVMAGLRSRPDELKSFSVFVFFVSHFLAHVSQLNDRQRYITLLRSVVVEKRHSRHVHTNKKKTPFNFGT